MQVVAFLDADEGFQRAREEGLTAGHRPSPTPVMWPAPGAPSSWDVPAIVTPAALATRLGLRSEGLDGLADRRGLERTNAEGPLRNYRYRWQARPSGGARLIEAPKPRLKAIQRRLLDEILAGIPPHDAAHGFRAGRSVRTFVAPHAGRRVVLKLDLRDFFPSISSARVAAIFLAAGYPEPVARLLAALCTNRMPSGVWDARPNPRAFDPESWRSLQLYRRPHLPQGAPTSPALANLCAFHLDARLAGLAASADARYTRYADDLAFSGDRPFELSVARFHVHACAIALEEGFTPHPRKTRVLRQGVRQRVAGLVLNDRPNIIRCDYDALKATIHNCVTHGPEGQNHRGYGDFRAHLVGRIAHVASVHPERGRRLREAFDRIAW